MAASDLILIDGFDMYGGTTHPITARWAGAAGTTTGRLGGLALSGSSFTSATVAVPGAPTQFSMGFAYIALTNLPSGNQPITTYRVAGSQQLTVGLAPDGSLIVGRLGDFTTTKIGQTASGVIPANAWVYIEYEVVISATVGVFNIYVNSVQVLALSGVNTKAQTSGTIDQLQFFPGANTINMAVDDFYMTSVASKLGECRVETVRPSADTAQKDWTPNSGTANFSRVNESTVDGDTSYISSATPGQVDLYDFPDLSSAPSTIHAVQTTVIARKDDATARTIRSKVKSGATTGNGATTALGTSYTPIRDIFVNDPNTSAAWTGANFNAAQAGVEEVA
jgi:hypothetical protein